MWNRLRACLPAAADHVATQPSAAEVAVGPTEPRRNRQSHPGLGRGSVDNLTTTSGLGFEFALVLLPLMWFGGGARRFWRKGLLLPGWGEDHLEQDCAA